MDFYAVFIGLTKAFDTVNREQSDEARLSKAVHKLKSDMPIS